MTWQVKPVGEVFRVVNGGTPKTVVTDYWGGPHQWITPAEMGGLTSPCLAASRRTLSDEGLRVGAELIPANSIILSSRAPIGHLVINAVPMAFNQGCKGLVPSKGIDTKFAYYFFLFNVPLLESLGTGATFKELSAGKLKNVPFCFPELAEQHRIVAILDEAFAGIATANSNAEKSRQNARAAFDSYLRDVFTHRGVGWVNSSIGEIADVKGGKRVPKGYKLESKPTKYPYLRVTDFMDSGTIDMSDLRYINEDVHLGIKNYIIRREDLYVSIAGTIGKTGIVPEEMDGANLTENACRLVFREGVNNRYVYYFTTTRDFIEQVGVNTRTAAQPKLALSRLATIRLSLPSIDKQISLATGFDRLREETNRLESLYTRKLAALDELKQSLLRQAFSGQL